MAQCAHCGREMAAEYRYCPWCATPHRRKLVEFFKGADAESGRALRVSRYLPERRVRFSVWDESGQVRAAVSIDEDQAARLAEFVAPLSGKSSLLNDLRAFVKR